ncbi:MAG: hypothetical protein IJA20_04765 [Methanocorpusculum sp.]|nr:hypothetical protein [Oscillospiraceae bacterium]MBQ3569972.1 hypothetical protein [Methanocorpusculum sp.]
MIIDSLYVPENCLQLESFSAHVLWNKKKNVIISIDVPEKLVLETLYNAAESRNNNVEGNRITLSEFNVNGYLGLVFRSEKYQTPKVIENITFTITSDGESETYNKEILLFRQDISLVSIPKEIVLDTSTKIKSTNKIILQNIGEGGAKIVVQIDEDSSPSVSLQPPEHYQEFLYEFRQSLDKHYSDLGDDYPEYQTEIEQFRKLISYTGIFDSKVKEKLVTLVDKLEKIFEKNNDFLNSFMYTVVQSYLENFNIIANIEQFSNYINSVNTGNIIIENALDHILLSSNIQTIRLKLKITDVANNDYPDLVLDPIKIKSHNEVHLPLYALFDFKTNNTKSNNKRTEGR